MATTIVAGSATPRHNTANTTHVGDYPASPQTGDVIVAQLYIRNNAEQTWATNPTGFSQVGPQVWGVAGNNSLWVRRSDGTETGSFQWTGGSSGGVHDVITYLVRGVPTDGPMAQTFSVLTDNTNDANYGLPGITTPSPGALAVAHLGVGSLGTTTWPGSWSEIYDTQTSVGTGDRAQSAATQTLANAGDAAAADSATGSIAGTSIATAVVFPSAPAEMPYFGGFAQTSHTNSSLTIPYNLPSGMVVHDWLLVHLQIRGSSPTASLPAGWTLIDTTIAPGSTIITQQVWVREVDGTEGTTVTATYSSLVPGHVEVSLIKSASGVDADTSFGTTTGTTTPSAPGLTTLGINRLLFYGATTASNIPSTPPSGFDEQYDLDANPAGAQHLTNYGATGFQLAAGPSGDKSSTATANAQWATFLVAFAPPDVTPPAGAANLTATAITTGE